MKLDINDQGFCVAADRALASRRVVDWNGYVLAPTCVVAEAVMRGDVVPATARVRSARGELYVYRLGPTDTAAQEDEG